MANNRNVYQQLKTVSIPKESLMDISLNFDLGETDFRVLLILFTELNGWSRSETARETPDPLNYNKIDPSAIANTLGIKKKQVKKAIERLCKNNLIEEGSSDKVSSGYRFTF